MDNLSTSDVDGDVSAVADEITGLCIREGIHCSSGVHLVVGCSRDAVTECFVDALRESGAVCSVREARAAVHVRITDKLLCIGHDIGAGCRPCGCIGLRG